MFGKHTKKLKGLSAKAMAMIVVVSIIFSTIAVSGLISFAEAPVDQMITIGSKDSKVANVVIPIVNPDTAKYKDERFVKLTFKAAGLSEGKMPIVGIAKLNQGTGTGKANKQRFGAKPEYVDNTVRSSDVNNTPSSMGLYCDYNKNNYTYEAIVKVSFARTIPSDAGSNYAGVCGYITIGNTEYGDGGTKDTSVSFTFKDVSASIMAYDESKSKWTESQSIVIPALTDKNVDFTKEFSETSGQKTNTELSGFTPSTDAANLVITAPKGKYSATTKDTNLVKSAKLDPNVFSAHNFVKIEEEEPKIGTKGTKAHYTCSCDDCKDKKFLQPNPATAVDDAGLEIPAATAKMIVVEKSKKASNVVIPFELNNIVSSLDDPTLVTNNQQKYTAFVKVKFKARVFSGTKPIIGVIGKDGDAVKAFKDNADNATDAKSATTLYCNYDATTLAYEAVVKIETSASEEGNDFALTIGNAEHDGDNTYDTTDYDLSFAMTEPEITVVDKIDFNTVRAGVDKFIVNGNNVNSYNTKFKDDNDDNIIFDSVDTLLTAPKNDFSLDGAECSAKALDIPEGFFEITHNFKFYEAVAASKETEGKKAYYEPICSEENCCFKNKLYLDKGYTEIAESDLNSGKWQKITIGSGHHTNVFVPLDLSEYVKSKHFLKGGTSGDFFVKLTFKVQMISGDKPVVSRMRGSTDQSDGQGGKIQGSWSEPTYTDNINETPASAGSQPVLYSKLNTDTNEYEAVIRLGIYPSYSVLKNGVHDAILIGNTNHNGYGYNGNGTDVTASFSFCEPQLYLLNATTGEVDTSTGNLFPSICEENIDFGTLYKHSNNPCGLSNHILSAPKNKWSVECNEGFNDVSVSNYTDHDFKAYKWILHKQENPTPTSNGTKAYYTCECIDQNCEFKDKKYFDKGVTEVTDESELTLTYSKMIKVGTGTNNVFVPLDLKGIAKSKHFIKGGSSGYVYVKLTFTARMITGDKPIVSRIRGSSNLGGQYSYTESGYADNTNETPAPANQEPVLYTKLNDNGKFEAVIKLGVGYDWSTLSNGVHDAILIGNAEHHGDVYSESDAGVSFWFCNPELYLMNATTGEVDTSTGNLIAPICDETLNFNTSYINNQRTKVGNEWPCTASNHVLTAPKNKWSIDGDKDSIEVDSIPNDFFGDYKFVFHPQINPTATTKGTKAYYSCECGNNECKYSGKKYSDKGFTEITNTDLGMTKMIKVGGGANNNVFVPLDLKGVAKSKHFISGGSSGYVYVKLTFKARMISGDKPIVSRVRGSSDLGGQYSYTESDHADNKNETPTAQNPLYTKLDATTGIYEAVIKLNVGSSWSTLSNGVHDAILIGNAEHHGNIYSESDSDVAFWFCDPELYLLDASTLEADTSTGNLIAPICDETLNFDKEYINNTRTEVVIGSSTYWPCTASNHVLTAPKNMWSIDGDKDNFEAKEIPNGFFGYFNFVYYPRVNPTATLEGSKAHYRCECGNPNCVYNGEYYSDKGFTKIDDISLSKTKMIVIGSNLPGKTSVANVYVPLNLSKYIKDKHLNGNASYVKLTFKARMLSGSVPIVSRMRGSSDKVDSNKNPIQGTWSEPDYCDNNDHTYDGITNRTPDFYTYYDESTLTYTAIIGISAKNGWSTLSNGIHDAILIGNSEHNGPGFKDRDTEVSFVFSDPELYLIDLDTGEADTSTGNLLAPICDQTLNFDKKYEHTTDNPCYYNTYKDANGNSYNEGNHLLSAPKEMWSIDGDHSLVNVFDIPEGYFEPTAERSTAIKITNGASNSIFSTTAILKAQTAYKVDIDYATENGGKLEVGYNFLNINNGYSDISDMGVSIDSPIDNVEGRHYSAVFTTPAASSFGTTGNNFKLIIGANGGTVKVANVKVRPVNVKGKCGFNALLNGDFRCAPVGTDYNNIYKFWNIENYSEIVKTEAVKINDGDFIDTTPVAAFVTDTTGKLTTDVSLKPNTKYTFKFASKYDSEEKAMPYVAFNGSATSIGKYYTDKDGQYNTVYTFTTPASLAGGNNTTVGVDVTSASITGAFSGFELYEVSATGNYLSGNLISDPYLLNAGKTSSVLKESGGINVEYKNIPVYYFKILKSKVLVFSGRNGYDSVIEGDHVKYSGNDHAYLEHTATIAKGKTYIFSLDYKFASEGYKLDKNDKNGPEIFVNVGSNFVTPIITSQIDSATEYKRTYIFETPSNMSEGENNFKFKFNVIGAASSGYLSNVSLHEYNGVKAIGEELIDNGDFATGDATDWTVFEKGYFYQMYYVDIPENFFSKVNPTKPNMMIYRDPTDYAQFIQHLMVKPNTTYQVEYKSYLTSAKFEDKTPYLNLYHSEFLKKDGEYVLKKDGRNVDSSTITFPKEDILYKSEDGKVIKFRTDGDIWTGGDGNILVFLVMRNGNTGIWGEVTLYELDAAGNKIGNNLLLNGDFTLGTTAWRLEGGVTTRIVQQPDGFFESNFTADPEKMIYSNGSLADQRYGNTFSLKKGQSYYFTGYYVGMNAQGVTPQITYTDITGAERTISTDLYYDPNRYYFEIQFTVPDDALFVDDIAKVGVFINNRKNGKGYFHSLMLSEADKFINLFDEVGFVGLNSNFVEMAYDPNVFIFYSDDSPFDDGDWSGEARLTDSDAKGVVVDENGTGVEGIKMVLNSDTTVTDASGNYSYKNLKPGEYTLSLVSPKTKKNVFCFKFTVEECKSITLPKIIYSTVTDEVQTEGEINSQPKSIVQCLLFDENGTRLSDIPIFIEDNGFAVTNKKGIATFDNLTEFGEKKVYINLDNGKKYVFRKVNIVEGKGTRIKLMYQEEQDNTLLYILIFSCSALVVIAGISVAAILIIKKKKQTKI